MRLPPPSTKATAARIVNHVLTSSPTPESSGEKYAMITTKPPTLVISNGTVFFIMESSPSSFEHRLLQVDHRRLKRLRPAQRRSGRQQTASDEDRADDQLPGILALQASKLVRLVGEIGRR